MKLCNNCQRELQDHQQICPYCGEEQEPVQVRYRRAERHEEFEEPVYDVASDKARQLVGGAVGGAGAVLSGYFGYMLDKWSGKNVRETSSVLCLLTLVLFSLFTGLLANIVARGTFLSFLQNFFIILLFVIVTALVGFLISKLLGHDRIGIFDFFYEFCNYLILPMLIALIGVVVGVLKAHNVAQIILFIVLFFVFSALITQLTKSHELDQPNHYPSLLIASLVFAGLLLFLTKLLF